MVPNRGEGRKASAHSINWCMPGRVRKSEVKTGTFLTGLQKRAANIEKRCTGHKQASRVPRSGRVNEKRRTGRNPADASQEHLFLGPEGPGRETSPVQDSHIRGAERGGRRYDN